MKHYTSSELAKLYQTLSSLPTVGEGQILPSTNSSNNNNKNDNNNIDNNNPSETFTKKKTASLDFSNPQVLITSSQRQLLQSHEARRKFTTLHQRKQTPAKDDDKILNLSSEELFLDAPEAFDRVGVASEIAADVAFTSVAPSGARRVIFRKKDSPNDPNGPNYYLIELWDEFHLLEILSTKDKHGQLYMDGYFRGRLLWNSSETKFIYTAEAKREKMPSFFDKKEDDFPDLKFGEEFAYLEDWGEQYENRVVSDLFLVDFEAKKLLNLWEEKPKDLTIGQATWSPDDRHLAFVGWPSFPRKLGLIYCYNRASSAFLYNFKTQKVAQVPITSQLFSARLPQFSPCSQNVTFLASNEKKTHGICDQIWNYNLQNNLSEMIVDEVKVLPSENGFPGIFCSNFFFLNSDEILMTSTWHSTLQILKISLKFRKVVRLSQLFFSQLFQNFEILDVKQNWVLVSASAPNRPPTVFLGDILNSKWSVVARPKVNHSEVLQKLEKITWQIKTLGKMPEIFQYIEINPPAQGEQREKTPLVVFPHGGPHSVFVGNFSLPMAFLALLGYSIILINYRGSTGFGKHLLDNLPGKCGDQDVQDCFDCMNDALKSGQYDESKLFYQGGSHSGFLGAHMIARDQRFRAAVLRNPVINISNMIGVTDIPDWCIVESGATGTADTTIMFDCSPLAKATTIKTPTLILLGKNDKRVPNSQGFQLYHQLRAQGTPVRLNLYPNDCHAIETVKAEADVWINSILFFQEHAKDL